MYVTFDILCNYLVYNKNEERSAKAFVQMRRNLKIIYILAEAEMFPVGE